MIRLRANDWSGPWGGGLSKARMDGQRGMSRNPVARSLGLAEPSTYWRLPPCDRGVMSCQPSATAARSWSFPLGGH